MVLAKKFIIFNNMDLNNLEKQLQELQEVDISTLTPEQLQEMIDRLTSITDIGEEMLYNDIIESEEEDNLNNEKNESYDESNS